MKPILLLALCGALVVLPACSDDPTGPGTNPGDVTQIVQDAGYLQPAANTRDDITNERDEYSGDYKYTYETHDRVDNISSVLYLGMNDDIIWPGSLIKGNQAHSFIYEPISTPRAPVTLSISLETSPNTGQGITEVVNDPKLSTLRQGINNLMKKAIDTGTSVPAQVDFDYQRVYNESHMSLYVGANVRYGVGELDTQFDWESTTRQTKIVAKYTQVYYSIDIDHPDTPADLFPTNIDLDALRTAMPPGSMPLYVAGVKYGWMAIMTIETSYSEESMGLALDAAYRGALDVTIQSGLTAREMMENSSIRIAVYGGSTAGLPGVMNGLQGFQELIAASHNFSADTPGVPLVYKFRHAANNNLALITMTSQYTLVRPLKIRQRVRITAQDFVCTSADDGPLDNQLEIIDYRVTATAWNRENETDPGDLVVQDANVYDYNGATIGTRVGDRHSCSGLHSLIVTFDSETHDFNLARLKLGGYAEDYDAWTSNDGGWGYTEILGRDFFTNAGTHVFTVARSDHFSFNVTVKLELLD